MTEMLLADYFYGDESEQFSYFRIPRLLITSPRFKGLSTDAKLLYRPVIYRSVKPLHRTAAYPTVPYALTQNDEAGRVLL